VTNKKTNFLILLASSVLVFIFSLDLFGITLKDEISKTEKFVKSRFNLSPPKDESITLAFGGDVMLGRSVLTKADRLNDYGYPLRRIKAQLNNPNIFFVNLESPFYHDCPRGDSGMIFCSDFKMINSLKEGGVNIVSLSNNHVSNYGSEGFEETKNMLDGNAILWAVSDKPQIKEVKGVTFGFLAFDLVSNKLKEEYIDLVRESDNKVDILIVSVHWGNEYTYTPNTNQKSWAKDIVDSGADVIIGHHPHWVQEMDYIDQKPVFYSLGNLVFDQMWSEETKKGELVFLTFEGKQLKSVQAKKVYIQSVGEPQIIEN